MRFICLDVETANHNVGSICQIGAVKVESGSISKDGGSLINPQESFSTFNIQIHGITSEDVNAAPLLPEVWDELLDFL
jgi:DNA polymerase-3 subunit epsilon